MKAAIAVLRFEKMAIAVFNQSGNGDLTIQLA
jgi:hypothetical protein